MGYEKIERRDAGCCFEGEMAIGWIIIWLTLHITITLIDIRKSLFALKTGLINAPVQIGVDSPK